MIGVGDTLFIIFTFMVCEVCTYEDEECLLCLFKDVESIPTDCTVCQEQGAICCDCIFKQCGGEEAFMKEFESFSNMLENDSKEFASCQHGTCEECKGRRIYKSLDTTWCCDGGISETLEVVKACELCFELEMIRKWGSPYKRMKLRQKVRKEYPKSTLKIWRETKSSRFYKLF